MMTDVECNNNNNKRGAEEEEDGALIVADDPSKKAKTLSPFQAFVVKWMRYCKLMKDFDMIMLERNWIEMITADVKEYSVDDSFLQGCFGKNNVKFQSEPNVVSAFQLKIGYNKTQNVALQISVRSGSDHDKYALFGVACETKHILRTTVTLPPINTKTLPEISSLNTFLCYCIHIIFPNGVKRTDQVVKDFLYCFFGKLNTIDVTIRPCLPPSCVCEK